MDRFGRVAVYAVSRPNWPITIFLTILIIITLEKHNNKLPDDGC